MQQRRLPENATAEYQKALILYISDA